MSIFTILVNAFSAIPVPVVNIAWLDNTVTSKTGNATTIEAKFVSLDGNTSTSISNYPVGYNFKWEIIKDGIAVEQNISNIITNITTISSDNTSIIIRMKVFYNATEFVYSNELLYTYSNVTTCVIDGLITEDNSDCLAEVNVIVQNSSINSGETTNIQLVSSNPSTTYTWVASSQGTTGASSGQGTGTITQLLTGTGIVSYTITPFLNGCRGTSQTVNINVSLPELEITNGTKINIWFDNSGSMDSTLIKLQTMVSSILRPCLISIYNNDLSLYNSRVSVRKFSDLNVIDETAGIYDEEYIYDERYIRFLGINDTSIGVTKTINLVFADESDPYEASFNFSGRITSLASNDILEVRNKLNTEPINSIVGVIFQVATGGVSTPLYPGFKTFVVSSHIGIRPFTGNNGLSDKSQIGYKLDVIPESTSQYYANLIIDALNNLGFNITPC